MSSPNLARLPAEITLYIAQNIKSTDDRRNLASCCRHLYDSIIPFVYENIRVNNTYINQTIRLVETLLRQPHVASWTRSLILESWDTERDHDYPKSAQRLNDADPEYPLPPSDKNLTIDTALIRGAVGLLFPSDDKNGLNEFTAHLMAGTMDAWMALLMFSLPNVEYLYITTQYATAYPRLLLERAAARKPPFDVRPALTRLAHVEIRWHDDSEIIGVLDPWLLPFYYFPSMRAISGDMVREDDPPQEVEEKDWKASNLQFTGPISSVAEIRFSKSNGGRGMRSQIECCKNLKVFDYAHEDSFGRGFNVPAFATSLASAKHSLEYLSLGYEREGDSLGFDEWEDVLFGSLTDYVSLKKLRMRMVNLVGNTDDGEIIESLTRILPRSLKYLEITHVTSQYCKHLRADLMKLLEPSTYSAVTPNLDVIKIIGGIFLEEAPPTGEPDVPPEEIPWVFTFRRDVSKAIKAIIAACKQVDVGFTLEDESAVWPATLCVISGMDNYMDELATRMAEKNTWIFTMNDSATWVLDDSSTWTR
ncbi:hypothetical protein FQN55_003137 [Onygenales sp. PD_40]|nr:hypothetical protein FQN55_003137 [Onygenales sp. PD_40]